jgi:hypothetical protein
MGEKQPTSGDGDQASPVSETDGRAGPEPVSYLDNNPYWTREELEEQLALGRELANARDCQTYVDPVSGVTMTIRSYPGAFD